MRSGVCPSVLSGHAAASASCAGEAAGDKAADATTQEGTKCMLVMSGGEGYIDFRMGEFIAWRAYWPGGNGAVVVEENMTTCVSAGDEDGEMEEAEDAPIKLQPKAERSHLIVWQVTQDWALEAWFAFSLKPRSRRGGRGFSTSLISTFFSSSVLDRKSKTSKNCSELLLNVNLDACCFIIVFFLFLFNFMDLKCNLLCLF